MYITTQQQYFIYIHKDFNICHFIKMMLGVCVSIHCEWLASEVRHWFKAREVRHERVERREEAGRWAEREAGASSPVWCHEPTEALRWTPPSFHGPTTRPLQLPAHIFRWCRLSFNELLVYVCFRVEVEAFTTKLKPIINTNFVTSIIFYKHRNRKFKVIKESS